MQANIELKDEIKGWKEQIRDLSNGSIYFQRERERVLDSLSLSLTN